MIRNKVPETGHLTEIINAAGRIGVNLANGVPGEDPQVEKRVLDGGVGRCTGEEGG